MWETSEVTSILIILESNLLLDALEVLVLRELKSNEESLGSLECRLLAIRPSVD